MRSIVVQRTYADSALHAFGVGASVIGMRTHDLGGTDFEPYLKISGAVAEGLVAGISNLSWRHARALSPGHIIPLKAKIDFRPDPSLDTRNFMLMVHEVGSKDLRLVGYLSKDQASELIAELDLPYIGPAKEEYNRIMARLKIEELRAQADAIEAAIEDGTAPSF